MVILTVAVSLVGLVVQLFLVLGMSEPSKRAEALGDVWVQLLLIPLASAAVVLVGSLVWSCLAAAPKQRDEAWLRIAQLEQKVEDLEREKREAREPYDTAIRNAEARADLAEKQIITLRQLGGQARLIHAALAKLLAGRSRTPGT